MGLTINTNVQAINAQRNLSVTGLKMSKAMERLSSGFRINRAADDAAGLAISEKLRSQIRGLGQASRNAQDGISMVQTAEGALTETHSIVQRVRELAVQASTSTLQDADRAQIQEEVTALISEINRIGESTTFNGVNLLSGAFSVTQDATSTLKVGVAYDTNEVVSKVDVSKAKAGTTYTLAFAAGTDTLTLDDGAGLSQSIVITALAAASGERVFNFDQIGVSFNVVGGGESAADALGTALAGATIVTAAGGGNAELVIGSDASASNKLTFSVSDMRATAIGSGAGSQVSDIDVSTQAGAQSAIAILDDALTDVTTQRAKLGAIQNRLEHTVASLGVTVENLSASDARIRESDIAVESSNLVTAQILQQAGTAVLAQANSAPQSVLSLLQ